MKRLITLILFITVTIIFSACAMIKPPLELSPNPEIIQKALYLQLEEKYKKISSNLQSSPLPIEIKKINVKQINPLFLNDSAVYHLQGEYNLQLQLNNKNVQHKNKPFDLYLERQKEGKTWHIISPNKH